MTVNQVRDPALAVSVSGVSKSFRRETAVRRAFSRSARASNKLALDHIDLSVNRGEMVAVVGLNGSGKSTLIRVLATLLLPDVGNASVFGFDVVKEAQQVRRHVNRVSVEAAFFKEMSPWENLSYATRLYGGGGGQIRERALQAMARLSLPRSVMDKPMKQLSRGQQQKVAIARCLLTSPSLLLMDEPTTGLDPHSKREVHEFVLDLHAESNITVLLCTHDLSEAEVLCGRVLVLDRGRILADASPQQLRAMHDGISLEDVFLKLTGKSFADDREDAASLNTGTESA